MRRGVRLVAALAVLMMSGACTGGADKAGREQAAADAPSLPPLAGGEPPLDPAIVAAADPRAVSPPLAAYALDDAKAQLVSRARILVGDRCMRDFGFAPLAGWQPEGAVPRNDVARYGLWDERRAADFGYVPEPNDGGNSAPVRYPSGDAVGVYLGQVENYQGKAVPAGGCATKENEAVFGSSGSGDVDGHFQADLDREAITRATQDSRVVPLLANWRACMKSAGWDFKSPQEPFDFWSSRRTGGKTQELATDEEKRSAVADVGCKKSTGLLGTLLAADIAYQKALVERDGEKLRLYMKQLDAIVRRANTIIADG